MSVEAINNTNNAVRNKTQKIAKQQTFTGSFNPIVTVMDAIDRGGFMAAFIAQDGIGMVAPRIYEGLNRNRERDENGKKTGPLNWEFARREGIREVLSGPSALLIPMGLLSVIKKLSGTANNVHVNHIKILGDQFAQYASENINNINETEAFRKGYYTKVFENILSNSTDKNLQGEELTRTAHKFADKLIGSEINKKEAKKTKGEIIEEFMRLRKSNTAASNDNMEVIVKTESKTLRSNINRMLQSMTDYTNDAMAKTLKHVEKSGTENIKEFINKFNLHRSGTRVFSNLGMWGAVVGFYGLIPKLYNIGLKHDPGLKGLVNQNENKAENNKDVAFTGGIASKAGKLAIHEGGINKILENFEFNGPSMPVPAMLTLLFGFTLPPRYLNAKSDKERKEILVRDMSSFTAILFAAKALARGFSVAFSKISGFALNIKPKDHSKGIINKLKNYFTAGHGIDVLSSEQIVSKYSKISEYKDGINGFFQFLKENGGDVRRVLNVDSTVKEQSEAIMKKFGGKSLKQATFDEINEAFKKAKNSEELEKIYSVFSSADNKFINRAKTYNSAFGFASTLILVPAFMMWLARYCEKMTKKAVAKENAEKTAIENANAIKASTTAAVSSKPTMAGFLNK